MDDLNKQFSAEHQFSAVPNQFFFGGRVNVTGLLTAGDILPVLDKAR